MNNIANDNLHLPPVTNRGAISAIKDGVFLLFDWVQATLFIDFKNYGIYDLFFHLFRVNRYDVLLDAIPPLFGYSHSYSYRHLVIFVSDDREDMGYHIYLTGQGCRDLEDSNISYVELFNKLYEFNCHFTRVDVSFDNFTNKYFNLDRIKRCINNKEVVTKFRHSLQFIKEDLDSLNNIGFTIWFGSRASDIQFVFYDKLKERIYNANKEIDSDIQYWNRLEMRFRNEKADTIIYNYMFCSNFNQYILGIINNKISFRIKSLSNSQRCRWQYHKWWNDFIDNVPKIKFQSVPIEYSISKKRSWLDHTCSYSSFCVLMADIKDFTTDDIFSRYLYEFFLKGSKKLSEKDLQYINQFRIKNNLVPISYSEVNDFIKNIKDIIIKMNK